MITLKYNQSNGSHFINLTKISKTVSTMGLWHVECLDFVKMDPPVQSTREKIPTVMHFVFVGFPTCIYCSFLLCWFSYIWRYGLNEVRLLKKIGFVCMFCVGKVFLVINMFDVASFP